MFVKVAKVGGTVEEITLDEGATIAEALDEAGIELARGQQVSLNGTPATEDTQIRVPGGAGFATVMISGAPKGGVDIFVKAAYVGGHTREVCVPAGSTVRGILAAADMSADGKSIAVNGNRASLDTRVNTPNANIVLSGAVKGGK